jgi:hypothetical protein
MSHFDNALKELREKRSQAQIEIEKLDQIIAGIESLNGAGVIHKPATQSRVISAASRRKMALAQKARWAGLRKKSQPIAVVAKSVGSAPAKRKISAAGRKKMAEASRARWAAFRAEKKKAA